MLSYRRVALGLAWRGQTKGVTLASLEESLLYLTWVIRTSED